MADPKLLSISHMDIATNRLAVSVERDVTDALTGLTTRQIAEVSGPLSALTGKAALATNLVAWMKAQTGFSGTVDVPSIP